MIEKLEIDKKRWGGNPKIPQFKLIKQKRLCEYWKEKNRVLYAVCWLVYKKTAQRYMTDIPASTQIGAGFKIEHVGGIVINPAVIIGEYCNIYNGVTIGKEKRGNRIGTPKIGDYVWIGANSIIVGNVKIGNDVLIAPGAFVNFDVPDHSIVIGNPARIIYKENATKIYIEV